VKLAWDPLAPAAVTGIIAVILYLREAAPRWCGFLAAVTVMFVTAGVPPLLALAHRPVTPGLAALIVMAGAAGGSLMFYLIVFKGHHKKPLFKHKGAQSGTAAGGGQQDRKAESKKTPHHKAMLATVGAMVFAFLLVSNWHAIAQTGRGGISQTFNEITQ